MAGIIGNYIFAYGFITEISNKRYFKKSVVDTDPPPGFKTETRYLLNPIPFAVRTYTLPDLFAGKMHAILCRRWKNRVKGRDLYDLVWYAANHPELNLAHLEKRMIQTEDWKDGSQMDEDTFRNFLTDRIINLDIDRVKKEVEPFVRVPKNLIIWSQDFFIDIASRIKIV